MKTKVPGGAIKGTSREGDKGGEGGGGEGRGGEGGGGEGGGGEGGSGAGGGGGSGIGGAREPTTSVGNPKEGHASFWSGCDGSCSSSGDTGSSG